MAQPASPANRAVYEEFLEVPDHLVAEILDGELHVSPRPAPRHARAGRALEACSWGRSIADAADQADG